MINIIGLVVGGMLLMQGILSESYVKIALSILCSNIFNGKTLVGLSTNIDGENYIEVNETLEQVRILVNGH